MSIVLFKNDTVGEIVGHSAIFRLSDGAGEISAQYFLNGTVVCSKIKDGIISVLSVGMAQLPDGGTPLFLNMFNDRGGLIGSSVVTLSHAGSPSMWIGLRKDTHVFDGDEVSVYNDRCLRVRRYAIGQQPSITSNIGGAALALFDEEYRFVSSDGSILHSTESLTDFIVCESRALRAIYAVKKTSGEAYCISDSGSRTYLGAIPPISSGSIMREVGYNLIAVIDGAPVSGDSVVYVMDCSTGTYDTMALSGRQPPISGFDFSSRGAIYVSGSDGTERFKRMVIDGVLVYQNIGLSYSESYVESVLPGEFVIGDCCIDGFLVDGGKQSFIATRVDSAPLLVSKNLGVIRKYVSDTPRFIFASSAGYWVVISDVAHVLSVRGIKIGEFNISQEQDGIFAFGQTVRSISRDLMSFYRDGFVLSYNFRSGAEVGRVTCSSSGLLVLEQPFGCYFISGGYISRTNLDVLTWRTALFTEGDFSDMTKAIIGRSVGIGGSVFVGGVAVIWDSIVGFIYEIRGDCGAISRYHIRQLGRAQFAPEDADVLFPDGCVDYFTDGVNHWFCLVAGGGWPSIYSADVGIYDSACILEADIPSLLGNPQILAVNTDGMVTSLGSVAVDIKYHQSTGHVPWVMGAGVIVAKYNRDADPMWRDNEEPNLG